MPDLAESWTVDQGGAVYRFRLRDGVTWHDGARFTAADVKFTFEEVLLKFHARTKASMGDVLAGIDAPDDRTVVFRFKQPYAPLLLQLDATEAPIVPRHVYQGSDPQANPANAGPVGTGPFKFASYKKGAEIRLVRNADVLQAAAVPRRGRDADHPGRRHAGARAGERRGRLSVGRARPAARAGWPPTRGSAWRRPRITPAGRTAS